MKLEKLVKTKAFDLRVKQHRAVLDFTTALEDAMVSAGLTQQALAKALNKSRAWVSKVFRRKPNLTFFTAVELADSLGFDLEIALVPSAMQAEAYPDQRNEFMCFAAGETSLWASASTENNVIQLPVQPSPGPTPTFTPTDRPRMERVG